MPSESKLLGTLIKKGHMDSNYSITDGLAASFLHRRLHGEALTPEQEEFIKLNQPSRKLANYLRKTHHQNSSHPLHETN